MNKFKKVSFLLLFAGLSCSNTLIPSTMPVLKTLPTFKPIPKMPTLPTWASNPQPMPTAGLNIPMKFTQTDLLANAIDDLKNLAHYVQMMPGIISDALYNIEVALNNAESKRKEALSNPNLAVTPE